MYRQDHSRFAKPAYRIIPENYSGNAFRNDPEPVAEEAPTPETPALLPLPEEPDLPSLPVLGKGILSGVKGLASDTSLLFLVLLILAAGGGEKDDGALFMILILLLL